MFSFTVETTCGTILAGTVHAEDACMLAACLDDEYNIRSTATSQIVWREGREDFPCGEGYVRAATIICGRIENP